MVSAAHKLSEWIYLYLAAVASRMGPAGGIPGGYTGPSIAADELKEQNGQKCATNILAGWGLLLPGPRGALEGPVPPTEFRHMPDMGIWRAQNPKSLTDRALDTFRSAFVVLRSVYAVQDTIGSSCQQVVYECGFIYTRPCQVSRWDQAWGSIPPRLLRLGHSSLGDEVLRRPGSP